MSDLLRQLLRDNSGMRTAERWRSIAGFEHYQISDLGRVRSARQFLKPYPSRQKNGRIKCATVTFRSGKQSYLKKVHRLVLEAFVSPMPHGMEGCHADGDPLNNKLCNLRWDTRRSNVADSRRHGTFRLAAITDGTIRGERHVKAKLRLIDVERIRDLRKNGVTYSAIAKWMGVNQATVSGVVNRYSWAHI